MLTPTFSHVMSVSLFILFSDHAHQTYFTCNKSCRIIITAMCFKRKITAQKQDFHMKDLDVSVYVCVYEKSRAWKKCPFNILNCKILIQSQKTNILHLINTPLTYQQLQTALFPQHLQWHQSWWRICQDCNKLNIFCHQKLLLYTCMLECQNHCW